MFRPSLLSLARRHLGWLLWLALLLPLAQAAAAAHAIGHLQENSQREGPDSGAPTTHVCEICTVASALGAGALPAIPPAFVLVAPAALPAAEPVCSLAVAAPPRHFLARAPPVSRS